MWLLHFIICRFYGHDFVETIAWNDQYTGEKKHRITCQRCGYMMSDEFNGDFYYSPAYEGYFIYSIPRRIARLLIRFGYRRVGS